MEENIIIEGKRIWFKFRILILLLVNYFGGQVVISLRKQNFWTALGSQSAAWVRDNLDSLDEMLALSILPYQIVWIVLFVLIIIYAFYGIKTSITVTENRIHGKNGFGKNVEVALENISTVRLSSHKGVAISADGKTIRFPFLKNRKIVYEEINKLLVGKDVPQTVAPKKEIVEKTSNIEEIKKYKELLDMGAITQEEFDAKKKQLLGL